MSTRRSERSRAAADVGAEGSLEPSTSSAAPSSALPSTLKRKRGKAGEASPSMDGRAANGTLSPDERVTGRVARPRQANGRSESPVATDTAAPGVKDARTRKVDLSNGGLKSSSNGSTKKASSTEDSGIDDALHIDGRDDELMLEEEERQHFRLILESYAPGLLQRQVQITKVEAGASTAVCEVGPATLEETLAHREIGIRALRSFLLKLKDARADVSQEAYDRREALRSHEQDQGSVAALHAAHTARKAIPNHEQGCVALLLSLVDSIAANKRTNMSGGDGVGENEQAEARFKQEHSDHTRPVGSGSAARKIALHMLLPTGHYFTSAVEGDAGKIDPGCANVISIAPKARSKMPVPTLGSRALSAVKNKRSLKSVADNMRSTPTPPIGPDDDALGERIVPATHLYYDAWSSFTPTYDSSDSTLGLAGSRLMWSQGRRRRDELRAKGWADLKAEGKSRADLLAAPMVAPVAFASTKDAKRADSYLHEADFAGLHPDLHPDDLAAAYEELEDEETIEHRLTQSRALLKRLQELQDARLRRGYKSGREVAPSAEEQHTASQALGNLTELVKLRPRLELESGCSNLIPVASKLRAAAKSAAVDPALIDAGGEPGDGYWGTLDEASYGPEARRRRAAVATSPVLSLKPLAHPLGLVGPPVIADNETVKLPEGLEGRALERLNARPPISSPASPNDLQQGKAATSTDEKKKRGPHLLDRIAASRSYDATRQDPHDRPHRHLGQSSRAPNSARALTRPVPPPVTTPVPVTQAQHGQTHQLGQSLSVPQHTPGTTSPLSQRSPVQQVAHASPHPHAQAQERSRQSSISQPLRANTGAYSPHRAPTPDYSVHRPVANKPFFPVPAHAADARSPSPLAATPVSQSAHSAYTSSPSASRQRALSNASQGARSPVGSLSNGQPAFYPTNAGTAPLRHHGAYGPPNGRDMSPTQPRFQPHAPPPQARSSEEEEEEGNA
ncbi:hypothetical protein CBOM_02408 [Ceraceosorus bombacis]|uniref:Uncharacterized protein n=1 Tax=Ceraceosorus bombacis TaxID=401625 RepID=A0A0P1BEL7_9BASI|nr:hypothetical protein CBOM_02408 [Ceraceosorus bombacis]